MTPTLEQLASPDSTLEQFIAFLTAIPSKNWYAGKNYADPKRPECRCVLGHLEHHLGNRGASNRLYELKGKGLITAINDGESEEYRQRTPKARVLQFLKDQIR